MKKLCILLPTFKRASCINYILEKSKEWINDYEFDYYICDSSKDDETNKIIMQYQEQYGEHLIYEKIDDYSDKTTDLKVLSNLIQLKNKYEFIHLCGDGFLINIPKYYRLFEKAINSKCTVIHFNNHLIIDEMLYTNGNDFVRDCGWYATYYGATTLASELICKANYSSIKEKYRNTGFAYWFGLLSAIATDNERILAYNSFPLENNPFKPANSSYQPGKFINFWVISWTNVIDDLPEYYMDVKEKLKKDIGNNLFLYEWSNLIRLKLCDNLSWKQVKKNRDRISQVTDVSFNRIALISLTPKPVLLCLLNAKKILSKLIKEIKR